MKGIRFKITKFIYRRKFKELKKRPVTSTEQLVIDICKRMTTNKASDLFVSPVSGDRYVHNESHFISISIKGDLIEIANHSYHYVLSVRPIVMQIIIKFHDRVIENRKRKLETTKGENINNSLIRILERLT